MENSATISIIAKLNNISLIIGTGTQMLGVTDKPMTMRENPTFTHPQMIILFYV